MKYVHPAWGAQRDLFGLPVPGGASMRRRRSARLQARLLQDRRADGIQSVWATSDPKMGLLPLRPVTIRAGERFSSRREDNLGRATR